MMRLSLISAVAVCALAAPAFAATPTISDAYTRVSAAENLHAPFTAPIGAQSVGAYSGFVEVNVSGSGHSLGSKFNEAFYPYGNGFYSLGIGWVDAPLGAYQPNMYASRLITFIEGVGPVAPKTLPPPNPAAPYSYRFVIDLGALTPQALQFGVLDGSYGDNGGAFDITLYQLREGAESGVPEPGVWGLMILGFGLAGANLRRTRAVVARAI